MNNNYFNRLLIIAFLFLLGVLAIIYDQLFTHYDHVGKSKEIATKVLLAELLNQLSEQNANCEYYILHTEKLLSTKKYNYGKDYWENNLMSYTASNNKFMVVSAGIDGVFGTGDDIKVEINCNM